MTNLIDEQVNRRAKQTSEQVITGEQVPSNRWQVKQEAFAGSAAGEKL